MFMLFQCQFSDLFNNCNSHLLTFELARWPWRQVRNTWRQRAKSSHHEPVQSYVVANEMVIIKAHVNLVYARSSAMCVHHHGNTLNSRTSCVVKRMLGKRDPFVQTERPIFGPFHGSQKTAHHVSKLTQITGGKPLHQHTSFQQLLICFLETTDISLLLVDCGHPFFARIVIAMGLSKNANHNTECIVSSPFM